MKAKTKRCRPSARTCKLALELASSHLATPSQLCLSSVIELRVVGPAMVAAAVLDSGAAGSSAVLEWLLRWSSLSASSGLDAGPAGTVAYSSVCDARCGTPAAPASSRASKVARISYAGLPYWVICYIKRGRGLRAKGKTRRRSRAESERRLGTWDTTKRCFEQSPGPPCC